MFLRENVKLIQSVLTIILVLGFVSFTFAYSNDSVKKDAAVSSVLKIKALKSQLKDDVKNEDIFDQMEQVAQGFYQTYPEEMKQPLLYKLIAEAVQNYDVERAKKLYQKIERSGSGDWERMAEDAIYHLSLLGKPLYLHFNSIDGRSVDLTQMKGKVVLIDFWMSAPGGGVEDLPGLKQMYEKYRENGFEIVGISLDTIQEPFLQVIKENKIPWPQYFEVRSNDNIFGRQYDINSAPTYWLMDKNGNLVDINAGDNVENKIVKLLGNVPVPGAPQPSSPTSSTQTTEQNYQPSTHLNFID